MSRGVCEDENRILGCAATAVLLPVVMSIAAILAAILVHGCAPSGQSVGSSVVLKGAVGSAVDVGCGTVAYDTRATPEQVASGTDYALRYMRHWFPIAPRGLTICVVQDGDLIVAGVQRRGARDLATGRAWLTYAPSGEVFAAEWEVPLLAQNVLDPPAWTWGTWGPLYAGQAPIFAALSR